MEDVSGMVWGKDIAGAVYSVDRMWHFSCIAWKNLGEGQNSSFQTKKKVKRISVWGFPFISLYVSGFLVCFFLSSHVLLCCCIVGWLVGCFVCLLGRSYI